MQSQAADRERSPDEATNIEDPHFCLGFTEELSRRDALDAVTCPSLFFSGWRRSPYGLSGEALSEL